MSGGAPSVPTPDAGPGAGPGAVPAVAGRVADRRGRTRLVLASKSPARRATLVAAGITPIVLVSHVDEPAVLAGLPGGRAFTGGTTTPADEVSALARAKCTTVAEALVAGDLALPGDVPPSSTGADGGSRTHPGTTGTGTTDPGTTRLVVLGCDSMLELDGRMLGKPHTPDVARARIAEMRGRDAVLWTGHFAVVLERPGRGGWAATERTGASASTVVHFGDITDAEIEAYVDSGEPLRVAGSFTIDGLGGPFVRGIEGDHHSVVGLSLPLLHAMLTRLGVFWPDLWDHRAGRPARP